MIAVSAGMPESTVRVYRDEFEEFLPTTGEGRRRRYEAESAERLRRICEWKRQGHTSSEIRRELERAVTPQERTRRRTGENRLEELITFVRSQASEIALLRAEVGSLRQEMRSLITTLQRDAPPSMEEVTASFMKER